jgi:WD40 repeat protein
MIEKEKNKKPPRKTIVPLLLTLILVGSNVLTPLIVSWWTWVNRYTTVVIHPNQLIGQVRLLGYYAGVLFIMLIMLPIIVRFTFRQNRISIAVTLLLMPVIVMMAWGNLSQNINITNYELRSETTIGGTTYYVGTSRRHDTSTASYSLTHFVYTCEHGKWCSYITGFGGIYTNTPIDEDDYPLPELQVDGDNRAVYAVDESGLSVVGEVGFEEPLVVPDTVITVDNAAQLQPLLSMITVESHVAWSPEGDYLTLEANFGPPRAYTIPDLELASHFFPTQVRNQPLSQIVFSSEGQHMVGVDEYATLRVWNWTTQAVLFEATIHNVQDADFNPDGSILAIIRKQPNVTLYDVATGSEIARFDDNLDTDWSHNARYSPDGRYIATISEYLRLWNTETGTTVALDMPSSFDGGCRVDFSPDGTLLAATASEPATVYVFDIASGEQLLALQTDSEWNVCGLDFSPDGTLLATGDTNGKLQLWNLETGTQVADIQAHSESIGSVQFNADATMIATSGSDNYVRVWGIGD